MHPGHNASWCPISIKPSLKRDKIHSENFTRCRDDHQGFIRGQILTCSSNKLWKTRSASFSSYRDSRPGLVHARALTRCSRTLAGARYRGSRQGLVHARTLARCSRKSKIRHAPWHPLSGIFYHQSVVLSRIFLLISCYFCFLSHGVFRFYRKRPICFLSPRLLYCFYLFS